MFEAKSKDSKKKKSKAKDRLFEDRLSRDQGQEWSRPRTEDTIFIIIVGKFSIISKRESFKILHFITFLMISGKQ